MKVVSDCGMFVNVRMIAGC